jgi:lipopolysaccharide export system protein LptC
VAESGDFYSRLVGVLKIGLPLLALVLLASLFILPGEERTGGGIIFSEGDLESLGEGLRITEPVLTGATRDDDPFRFTAKVVVPDAAPPTRAAIEDLAGGITFAGGQRFEVEAPVAEVDLRAQVMEAGGRVTVTSSDGYRISADEVMVDLVAGTLEAEGDIDGAGPMGTIAAERMTIVPAEGGGGRRVFSFGNGVTLRYEGGNEQEG